MNNKGLLIVLSGPSGSGKGTVCKELLKNKAYWLSISATTRNPREGEKHGESYYFLSKEEFKQQIEKENFLEYAEVYGNFYGTPKDTVMDKINKGINVILEIDIQGALMVKEMYREAILIFITPPSMEELKNRIIGRNSETEESFKLRFQSAFKELEFVPRYEYMVVNDKVDQATQKIESIITAEKCRVNIQQDFYKELIGGYKNE